MLPMSLRKVSSEQAYADAKKSGNLVLLQDEPTIHEWKLWKVIENRFPYDMVYKTHHLLVPKREFADFHHMTPYELLSLKAILKKYAEDNYDLWFVNTGRKRSIPGLFHIHLAVYVDTREEVTQ